MIVLKDGSIIAGGVKIGTASIDDVSKGLADGTLRSDGNGAWEYIQQEREYTKDDVKQELKFLEQKGYFNLPDNHLLNGSPISKWKKLWNEIF
jgi:hypothetical protein